VDKSRISRKDNDLNHESQDHNVYVKPDLKYRRLLRGTQDTLEVEWERDHFPEVFRPTTGDRVSVWGYWILDCGHDYKTEIHPPVGIAVHRARPIQIPSTALFRFPSGPGDDITLYFTDTVGTNVYVPGILTDIWFNRDSGEITSNCSTTGLHQPGHYDTSQGPAFEVQGDCIRGPSPINRIFTFNIYLPPKPELSGSAQVPLYFKVFDHPYGFSSGSNPQIVRAGPAATPYLSVTIDLRNFTGSRYARRIHAGWVLASPDNWGLKRWKVQLNALDVHNDADCNWCGKGDGDWRFWVNLNNSAQEWTKLFDCDGCVHGTMIFGGRPWQTGTASEVPTDRRLGSDVLLFPNQRIWIHTSGFEEDIFTSDDTGSVYDLKPQATAIYHAHSTCTSQTSSGCGEYTLHYQISAAAPIPSATLSFGAQTLLNDYFIGPNTTAPCLICQSNTHNWYPYDAMMAPSQPSIPLSTTLLFRMQPSLEKFALTDITIPDLYNVLSQTRQTRPQLVARVMRDLRRVVDQKLSSPRANESIADILILREAIPPDLWTQYFGDLRLYRVSLPLVIR
jgi:hypothetical protein